MIAVISDIHSNSSALNAVLQDIDNFEVNKIFCLGDIVNGADDPNGTINLIRERNIPSILGNHEYSICDTDNGNFWISQSKTKQKDYTLSIITKDNLAFLKRLPRYMEYEDIHFAHSVPPDHPKMKLRSELEKVGMEKLISTTNKRLCFVGHSHKEVIYSSGESEEELYSRIPAVQVEQKIMDTKLVTQTFTAGEFNLDPDKPYIINVGSVGLQRPYHASYCLFNPDTYNLKYRHVFIDDQEYL